MRKVAFWLTITVLLPCLMGISAEEPKAPPGPKDVVQKFFEIHFAHEMGFTRASLEAKESWLSADLARLLHQELNKPASPNEVPNIDGDPFTDSQEYPKGFRVMDVSVKGDKATVRVRFTWPQQSRVLNVLLVRESGQWRIDDFVYDKDQSLRKLVS